MTPKVLKISKTTNSVEGVLKFTELKEQTDINSDMIINFIDAKEANTSTIEESDENVYLFIASHNE